MRFSLRTLLIAMMLGGPALAGLWWGWCRMSEGRLSELIVVLPMWIPLVFLGYCVGRHEMTRVSLLVMVPVEAVAIGTAAGLSFLTIYRVDLLWLLLCIYLNLSYLPIGVLAGLATFLVASKQFSVRMLLSITAIEAVSLWISLVIAPAFGAWLP